jgi:hypothetical protein
MEHKSAYGLPSLPYCLSATQLSQNEILRLSMCAPHRGPKVSTTEERQKAGICRGMTMLRVGRLDLLRL